MSKFARLLKLAVCGTIWGTGCLPLLIPMRAAALSEEQRRITDSKVLYVTITEKKDDGNCANVLPGSDNKEKIWNYLVGTMGLSATQAAGVMGNMQQESGFSPTALNKSSGAYGIIQWFAGRKTGLQNFANQQGKDISDLGMQLDYMKLELESDYYKSRVLDPIKASTTIEEATRIWLERFEIPCLPGSAECGKEMRKRLPFSRNVLTQFGSSSGGSGGCSSDSGKVVNGLSLPLSESIYTKNPGYFTQRHHDYPAADIPVPTGTPVYSMTSGKVISAPVGGDCGVGILIDAGDGITLKYCHGSDGGSVNGARKGDTVKAGQLIMHSASTGHSTGPHLHVEIDISGSNRCPQTLFTGIVEGTPPEIKDLPGTGCVGG